MRTPTLEAVAAAIRANRFAYASEDTLQAGLAGALEAHGFDVVREARLDGRSRIDLLVGRIGVEAKTAGGVGDVSRQIARYLAHPAIDGVVLVTTRVAHLRLDRLLGDPRLEVVTLASDGL